MWVAAECLALAPDDKLILKVTDAKAIKIYNCEIVSIDWLLDSQKEGKPLAVDNYALGITKDRVDAKNKANGKKDSPKKKRTLEEVLHEGEDEDDKEDGARKRVKDAQTVGSKKLNVPVDEACYLQGDCPNPDGCPPSASSVADLAFHA